MNGTNSGQVRVRGRNLPTELTPTPPPPPPAPTPPPFFSREFWGLPPAKESTLPVSGGKRFALPGQSVRQPDPLSELIDMGGQDRVAGRQFGSIADRIARSAPFRQARAAEEPASQTYQEWLAANTAEFDETPYQNYMNFLLTQDEETMARINAMYRQLAADAEENMARVADVYEGAEAGVGGAYGSARDVVGESYESAQQQAADQLARLGIEEAAPDIINPMALSQAEALANVATGEGAALGATRQFGATAQDFASQMGQVGQQQGLEVSSQILRDILRRQAEATFQMEQARAQFDPYANALRQLEMERAFYAPQMEADRLAQEQAFEAFLSGQTQQSELQQLRLRSIIDLMSKRKELSYDEAALIVDNTLGISTAQ